MAAVDAQFYWMSAKVPNDQFLLYAFDGEPTDLERAVAQVYRRARGCPGLGMRVQDRGALAYPQWVPTPVQRDQVQRLGRRAGLFGQQLRIIERVVEGVQRAHHRVCRAEELAAGLAGVQRVVIQIARHQHIGAADFVHRGAPRRVGS